MSQRDARNEIEVLIKDMGLSENEALEVLGLDSADDPLLADFEALDRDQPIEVTVSEMFPEIPHDIIRESLNEHSNDPEKASEYLLSWAAVKDEQEAQISQNTRETKQERKMRRQHHKHQKAVDNEEKEIGLIAATLSLSLEESRGLYWSHENNVSEALLATIPRQQVISGAQKIDQRSLENKLHEADLLYEQVSEYSNMKSRELKALLVTIKRKMEMLKSKATHISRERWDRIRASDAAAELQALKRHSRNIQLALLKLDKLHGGNSMRGIHCDGTNSLVDLHGCTLDQAKVLVIEALDAFQESTARRLELITGVGHHSAKGQAVLKPWLRAYLKQKNVRMEELEGSFVVSQNPRI